MLNSFQEATESIFTSPTQNRLNIFGEYLNAISSYNFIDIMKPEVRIRVLEGDYQPEIDMQYKDMLTKLHNKGIERLSNHLDETSMKTKYVVTRIFDMVQSRVTIKECRRFDGQIDEIRTFKLQNDELLNRNLLLGTELLNLSKELADTKIKLRTASRARGGRAIASNGESDKKTIIRLQRLLDEYTDKLETSEVYQSQLIQSHERELAEERKQHAEAMNGLQSRYQQRDKDHAAQVDARVRTMDNRHIMTYYSFLINGTYI